MVKKIGMAILKDTLLEMLVSVILLLIAAFVVLKISPSAMVIKIIVLGIYAVSSFVGGFILGKVMDKRKFLWGMISGAVYFIIIMLVAFIVNGNVGAGSINVISGLVASVVAGMLGGMVS